MRFVCWMLDHRWTLARINRTTGLQCTRCKEFRAYGIQGVTE